MKIGITCCDIVFLDNIRIFANGHHYNVLLWYHFFKLGGYDVVFLSNTIQTGYIINDRHVYEVINYNDIHKNNCILAANINMVLFAGLTDTGLGAVLKKQGMLLCYCTDEYKKKTLFSSWEIRPYPEN